MRFQRKSFLKPTVTTDVAERPLEDASLPERFAPAPPRDPPTGPTQPFGDARQNGRLDGALGHPDAVSWRVRWTSPLREDTRAHSVLQHGDAVLVQAAVWQLFGRDGALRSSGRSGSSPMVITPGDGGLRWVDSDGCLVSAPLATGEPLWSYGLHHGDNAVYPYLAARGDRTLVIGGERLIDPEADPQPVTTFAVEVIEVAEPAEVSPGGLLLSAKSPGALTTESSGDVFAALGEETALIAWRDHVMTLGLDLSVKRLSTARFEPRSVSVGDAGRVYMVVRADEGPELWMLNARGERVFTAHLPEEATDSLVPPLVAPDHRVFVATSKRVAAFSPTGDWLWEFYPGQGTPYASVTSDGWLLVAVEHHLGVLDGYGQTATLFSIPDEVFRTAPVLTPEGEILVATDRSLLCLEYVDPLGRASITPSEPPGYGPVGSSERPLRR